ARSIEVIESRHGEPGAEVAERVLQEEGVEFIEPDFVISGAETLTQRSHNQWAHQKIRSEEAWKATLGSPDIVVAVIDSGIDFKHPDLKHSAWKNPREVLNGKDDDNNGFIDDLHGWDFVDGN